MDRRAFVHQAGASFAACSVLSACGGVAWTPVPAPQGRVRLDLNRYPELDRRGGSLKILPEGHGDPVYVLEQDGAFIALSPICTHRGCTVDIEGPRLVCPCHGSTYQRSGEVVKGPAERPLQALGVSADGRMLVVDVSGVGRS